MATEDDEEKNTHTDPPADPPADPPTHTEPHPLESVVSELSQRVDALSAQVESLAITGGERDTAPVSVPWTARGRR